MGQVEMSTDVEQALGLFLPTGPARSGRRGVHFTDLQMQDTAFTSLMLALMWACFLERFQPSECII